MAAEWINLIFEILSFLVALVFVAILIRNAFGAKYTFVYVVAAELLVS